MRIAKAMETGMVVQTICVARRRVEDLGRSPETKELPSLEQ
jgi:hypothetical protein